MTTARFLQACWFAAGISLPHPVNSAEPSSAATAAPVCALSPQALQEQRAQLIPGLFKRALEVTDLPQGLRFRFENKAGLITDLAGLIQREQTCCSFLAFSLRTEASGGSVFFEVTGPPGTREMLRAL